MKTKLTAMLLLIGCMGCVTDEDDNGSINPSDVAFAGTGLAVLSSADFGDFNNDNDNSSFNSSNPNNSNPNSTFNSSNPNSGSGTNPWDLDCDATLTISGALNETLTDTSGCSSGSGGSSQTLSWVWGLQTQYQLSVVDAPIRSDSDTSSFTAEVIFRPFAFGADGPETGWLTTCTINIDSSDGYLDGRGDPNTVWIGGADCPDPAGAVERSGELGAEWMSVDGDPIIIESFSFETPFPSAL